MILLKRSISIPERTGLRHTRLAHIMLGEVQIATKDLDEAIRLDPNVALAYVGRGLVLMKEDQHESAIQKFDEAVRLDPRQVLAYRFRGIAYLSQDKYEIALSGECRDILAGSKTQRRRRGSY